MTLRADLHIHTTSSDGKNSPEKIIELSKENNLNIISITDHDTLSAVATAIDLGHKLNVKVIPGVELSTSLNGESIHLLGYFKKIPTPDSPILEYLVHMEKRRIERSKKILENLKKYFSIELSFDNIFKNSKGIITRPHIARAIIEEGYNYSYQYIFEHLIGNNSKAYIPNERLPLEEGIALLKSSKALTVLAHPVLIKKNKLEDVIKHDFHGIEAIYYLNSEAETNSFIKISKKYNKIITAGSDFHGYEKDDLNHPSNLGTVFLEKPYLDIFLNNLNNI